MPERPNQREQQDQKDPRRLNLNPGDFRHRGAEQFQAQHQIQYQRQHQQHHHHQRFEHAPAPQFGYPQQFRPQIGNWNDRDYGHPRHFHHRHFQNPYDGMNNYWRDSWQDNYYHDRHHHRHRDKDDLIPRVLEGILGGILSGSLVRELDKLKVDGNQIDISEDEGDNDRLDRAFREDKSPDRQISINLDFSPQGQTSGLEARFERTG